MMLFLKIFFYYMYKKKFLFASIQLTINLRFIRFVEFAFYKNNSYLFSNLNKIVTLCIFKKDEMK